MRCRVLARREVNARPFTGSGWRSAPWLVSERGPQRPLAGPRSRLAQNARDRAPWSDGRPSTQQRTSNLIHVSESIRAVQYGHGHGASTIVRSNSRTQLYQTKHSCMYRCA